MIEPIMFVGIGFLVAGLLVIGVIPLVVRNPSMVQNINKYIECLSIAHRKVQFRNERGLCNLLDCDEMIILK